MNRVERFERPDWIAAATVFAACLALCIPCRSTRAYHWDGVQFMLALTDYNVALSQPHAPGYFLYVMAGRLVNLFIGDAHASLMLTSMMSAGGLAATVYLLGAAMFSRRAGRAAAVFAATSPIVWFHGCVALTYIVDGFLVCLVALACWRAIQRGGTWADAVVIGALLAVAGGVRLQTAPGLLPLAAFTLWTFRARRAGKAAVLLATAVVFTAAWFVPMVSLSGGWAVYGEVWRRFAGFNAPLTLAGGGWAAVQNNFAAVIAFCWNGLGLGALLLAGGAFCLRTAGREHRVALVFLTFWIVPMLVLGTLISFTRQPGFVLSYLPALFLAAGWTASLLQRRWHYVAATAVVCAAGAVAFLSWPAGWDGVFFKVGRTAREIRQHDRELGRIIGVVRAQFKPADTVICHAAEFYLYGMRVFQPYLPEFDHCQMERDRCLLAPPDKPMWRLRNGRTEFASGLELEGKQHVLLVVPPGQTLGIFRPYFDVGRAQPVESSNDTLFRLPVAAARHFKRQS